MVQKTDPLRDRNLRIIEHIKNGKSNSVISEIEGITPSTIRSALKKLRKEGFVIPKRNPIPYEGRKPKALIYPLKNEIERMRKDLASVQTGHPGDHLRNLQKHPPYRDVKFKQR